MRHLKSTTTIIRKEKVTDHIEQELELSIINIIIMRDRNTDWLTVKHKQAVIKNQLKILDLKYIITEINNSLVHEQNVYKNQVGELENQVKELSLKSSRSIELKEYKKQVKRYAAKI